MIYLLLIAALGPIVFALMLARAASLGDEQMERENQDYLRALERVHRSSHVQ